MKSTSRYGALKYLEFSKFLEFSIGAFFSVFLCRTQYEQNWLNVDLFDKPQYILLSISFTGDVPIEKCYLLSPNKPDDGPQDKSGIALFKIAMEVSIFFFFRNV